MGRRRSSPYTLMSEFETAEDDGPVVVGQIVQGAFQLYPNYGGDECGEVSASFGGRPFHAHWAVIGDEVRVLGISGLLETGLRDPAKGSAEDQARHLLGIMHARQVARSTPKPDYPVVDGWLDPRRLP